MLVSLSCSLSLSHTHSLADYYNICADLESGLNGSELELLINSTERWLRLMQHHCLDHTPKKSVVKRKTEKSGDGKRVSQWWHFIIAPLIKCLHNGKKRESERIRVRLAVAACDNFCMLWKPLSSESSWSGICNTKGIYVWMMCSVRYLSFRFLALIRGTMSFCPFRFAVDALCVCVAGKIGGCGSGSGDDIR